MKMKFLQNIALAALNLALLGGNLVAQTLASPVKWEQSFGGDRLDGHDFSVSFLRGQHDPFSNDHLVACISKSGLSGTKSDANRGGRDMWMVKYDDNGLALWDKTYGGSGDEDLAALVAHSSGAYFLIGTSNSPISGEKSVANHPAAFLQRDAWIVKTDLSGNVLWDKIYGGGRNEEVYAAIETYDGGIVVVAATESNTSYDISSSSYSNIDAWIFKIDVNGNLVWERRLGGDGLDKLQAIVEMPDHSLLLAGGTNSNVSGDVSTIGYGAMDFWAIRLDESGNPIWDARYGSSEGELAFCMSKMNNGDLLIGGASGGPADGSKTQAARSSIDYWVIRIDGSGQQIWDRVYGGLGADQILDIHPSCDGNYLLGGFSNSGQGFEKSAPSQGGLDYWVLKIDALGNARWDLTLGGSQDDMMTSSLMKTNGEYLFSGFSKSGISGDKASPNFGDADYWVLNIGLKAGFAASQDTICEGMIVTFEDQSTAITEQFAWEFGDPSSGLDNQSSSASPSHTYNNAGTYTVTQIVFEGCQIPDTLRKEIVVLPAQHAVVAASFIACLSDQVLIGASAVPGLSYQWFPASGLNDPFIANPIFTVDSIRTFTLQTSNGYCSDQASVTITPASASAGTDLDACLNQAVTLNGVASAGMQVSWTPAFALNNANILQPEHIATQSMVFTMTAILGNCTIVDSMLVQLAPAPIGQFSFVPQSPLEDEPVAFVWQGSDITQATWNFGDGLFQFGSPLAHPYHNAGTYTVDLLVQNSFGCQTELSQMITVGAKPRIFIPTAFTPNGDGLNDEFQISHAGLTSFLIQIYDRSGKQVYASADPNFLWDGQFAGSALPEGVYAYKLTAIATTGERIDRRGSLTLIR